VKGATRTMPAKPVEVLAGGVVMVEGRCGELGSVK
jgi:hypothetical protein